MLLGILLPSFIYPFKVLLILVRDVGEDLPVCAVFLECCGNFVAHGVSIVAPALHSFLTLSHSPNENVAIGSPCLSLTVSPPA